MAARGRSRRTLSFSVDSVGINRGESLPPTLQQPTPVFPVMEQKPLPLTGGEEAEYLLALKQDFRGAMRSLPCFIQPAAALRDVERYSDKYHSSEHTDGLMDWTPDWQRFPRELRIHVKKPARDGVSVTRSDAQLAQKKKKKKVREKEEVLLKLETLQKKEEQQSEEDDDNAEQKKKQEDDDADGEEEYDEEEFEEETDYIMSYFDNGEDFGGDSDDNMDEAIY
ncbi:RNA polymerase III subunit GL b [Acanthochromis polyacanthus]|uniref:DNA-directed RNA polymerase III subunit RPC7-like n=1 Tax=Acanthochromis polyacanthus TaxID=80966 RepID=A0A3Q1FNJ3_9TELE|nr:RNA polymerase III subunit GL b [Acanthochromis polyacanthus]